MRNPTRRAFLFLIAAAAGATGAEPFFFIQMSDPQFGMYAENRGFEQETANFEFAIATANRLKPAFVVVTGDLVNKAGDEAQIAEYKRIAAKLDRSIPIYNVPGNHDVGGEPAADALARWRENFGPDRYSFRVRDTAFFVLDSPLIFDSRNAPQEAARQERWLEEELAKARRGGARRLVVFQHHPFFITDPAEKDQYFNLPGPARRKYLELLRGAGVSHVFAGHHHRNGLGRDGALEMVTTGPVGKPLGEGSRSGIRVVVVRDEGIRHRFYDFGDLPNRIGPAAEEWK